MNTKDRLFLSILITGALLIAAQSHAYDVDGGKRAANQTEFSTMVVQPVGWTHFSFGFHIGRPHHYGYGYGYGYYGHRRHGYYGHHRGYDYKKQHYRRSWPWYKGRGYRDHYRYWPSPPHYRHRGPYYRHH